MDYVSAPLALGAGVLTIVSPCVLPLLPIVLGTAVDRGDRLRPLLVVAGFVLTFAGLGLALSAAAQSSASLHELVRNASLALLLLFGVARLWPALWDRLVARLSGPLQTLGGQGSGKLGGFILGTALGAVWTPCAGPVLASILVLAAQADDIGRSALLLFSFALGAGLPMLGIAYGGQRFLARLRGLQRVRLQQGFGALLILTALAIHFQYDLVFYAWVTQLLA